MITEFEFHRLDDMAHLAWAALAVLLLCAWGVARRRQILEAFGIDSTRFGEWLTSVTRRRWLRATTLTVSILFLTAAAVQPRCNPEKKRFKQRARDIAILVDVSRSMLATDLKPNRLERAKLELERLCDRLKGDRIGLVAFAGDAVIQCPLTSNYSYFKSVLKNISHRSASQGGTRIGDAIRKALDDLLGIEPPVPGDRDDEVKPGETVLDGEMRSEASESYADLLLITDGEDHDSYPIRAARRAAEADVGLYVIGLGSEDGTPIPIRAKDGGTEYLKYKGKVVLSRLDSKTVQEMVLEVPRGAYTPAGTASFDLVEIFEGTLGQEEGREIFEEHVSWTEIYQPFLLTGLFFYVVYLLLSERPGKQQAVELLEANVG